METAYVMINCEMGAEGTIVEGVKSIDSVKEVSGVFGNYDIIVKLECLNIDEIRETIATKIRLLSNVRCTTTLMCAN
ncbi:MAG: Lrp/AsnC ligand binding domain-containing protein [Nitrosotalea sp.]